MQLSSVRPTAWLEAGMVTVTVASAGATTVSADGAGVMQRPSPMHLLLKAGSAICSMEATEPVTGHTSSPGPEAAAAGALT